MTDSPIEDEQSIRKVPPGDIYGGYNTEIRQNDSNTANIQYPGTARPELSWLTIRIPPENTDLLRKFAIIGFREELMHGNRQTFGLTRNARILRRD